jgi:hypothetical protein
MNAAKEFLEQVNGKQLRCATVTYNYKYNEDVKHFNLKVGFGKEQLEEFLKLLDFDYDNGFGGQELYGTIWYRDNTWATRGEYDGSEWWQDHKMPDIPAELLED